MVAVISVDNYRFLVLGFSFVPPVDVLIKRLFHKQLKIRG